MDDCTKKLKQTAKNAKVAKKIKMKVNILEKPAELL